MQNVNARNQIVETNMRLVYAVARKMCRKCWSLTMDEAVQDGVVGLLTAVDRYRPGRGASFSTFATTRIRGGILDGLRLRAGAKRHHPGLGLTLARLPAEDSLAAPPQVDLVESRDFVDAMVQGMSRHYRLLTILIYIDGLSQREVADVIGIKPPNVSIMHQRARARMRKRYQVLDGGRHLLAA